MSVKSLVVMSRSRRNDMTWRCWCRPPRRAAVMHFSATGRMALARDSVVTRDSAAMSDATSFPSIAFWWAASPPSRRPRFGVPCMPVSQSLVRSDRPRSSSRWMTSSRDFCPKLVIPSRSSRVLSTSSPIVLIWARFRQLRGRSERSSSSMRRSRPRGASSRSATRPTRVRRVSPAEASASRGLSEPSVSMSSTKRSKSVDCSTRTGSTSKVTRRTGEKMESTGMTPIVDDFLLRSADTYPRPRSTVTSRASRPLALSVAMCSSGFKISTSAVAWRSAAVASPGPRLSKRSVTGSSDSTLTRRSLKFKMMSVTSSFTPVSVVNSCRASSKRTWVTAAPGIEDKSVRRSEFPSVWPKPGSSGPTANRWRLSCSSSMASTVGRWMMSIGGAPQLVNLVWSEPGWAGPAFGLLRVQLDDELFLDGLVDVLPQGRVQHLDREPGIAALQPGRPLPVECVHVAADDEHLARRFLQCDGLTLADPVARYRDALPVDQHVAVAHELAGLAAAGSPAGPGDPVGEAHLEHPQQVLAGDAGLAVRLLVEVAELLLQNAVDAAGLLLLAQLGEVFRPLAHAVAAVLTGRVGAAVPVRHRF